MILEKLITANHRKNSESKYDRKLAEIDVVTSSFLSENANNMRNAKCPGTQNSMECSFL